MSCSANYYLLTCSQRRLVGADVCSARTSRRYQNRKFTVPLQFGIVRFGGTLPLFLIYFYINRAVIQYLYILLVEYHFCYPHCIRSVEGLL
jgi:hypothetical protein